MTTNPLFTTASNAATAESLVRPRRRPAARTPSTAPGNDAVLYGSSDHGEAAERRLVDGANQEGDHHYEAMDYEDMDNHKNPMNPQVTQQQRALGMGRPAEHVPTGAKALERIAELRKMRDPRRHVGSDGYVDWGTTTCVAMASY